MSEKTRGGSTPGGGNSSDQERLERISRYKEARRKQLQQQIADKNIGSGSSSTETGQRRYINRRRPAEQQTDVSSSSDAVRVRETRASRLRAAQAGQPAADAEQRTAQARANRAETTPTTIRPNQVPSVSSATKDIPTTTRLAAGDIRTKNERSPLTISASSDGAFGTTPRSEKDKSSKRKSNLNRALNSEETHALISTDETSARRRRSRLNPSDVMIPLTEPGLNPPYSASSSNRVPPAQPTQRIQPTNGFATTPKPRKSELSIHMENARRGIHTEITPKPKPVKKHSFSTSVKSKSDTERKKSSSLESEGHTRSLSDIKIRKKSSSLEPLKPKSNDEIKIRLNFESPQTKSDSDLQVRHGLEALKAKSELNTKKTSTEMTRQGECDSQTKNDSDIKIRKKSLDPVRHDEVKLRLNIDSPKINSDSELQKCSEIKVRSGLGASKSDTETRKTCLEMTKTRFDSQTKTDSDRRKPSRTFNVSKRMDELTAITKETLSRVEKLTTKSQTLPRRKSLPKVEDNISIEPSSILKNKSLDENPLTSVHTQNPVSILKRKPSHEEATSSTSTTPVTFSPSVIDNTSRKKQGILKKRSSLDESHRRRSYSPDVALIEASTNRPILKTQRRSSLEDIIRARSPDLQGILKRKHSGEEDFQNRSLGSPEPQGILKRKSGTSSSGSSGNSPHVSIATAVILAAAGGAEIVLDTVKPILKKKSFSEEYPSLDLSQDIPKPILKKKLSIDDDPEDKPMKPILKSCRKSSEETGRDSNEDSPRIYSVLRSRSSCESGSECEMVRPILKQSSSRENSPRLKLSFSNESYSARTSPEVSRKPPVRRSNTLGDSDMGSILSAKRAGSSEEVKPNVFSMILNFEKGATSSTGAVPKKNRDKARFSTQPITFDEFEATASLATVQICGDGIAPEKHNVRDHHSSEELSVTASSSTHREHGQLTYSCSDERYDHQLTHSVTLSSGDSGVLSSKMSLEKLASGSDDDDTSREEDIVKSAKEVCRSNSVSSKTNLFKQLEAQMKAVAEEAKNVKLNKGNKGMQKYRNRKTMSELDRFATQPVTLDEVQEAARINSRPKLKSVGDEAVGSENNSENEEPDPSKLSLAERVKLFNRKITEDKIPLAGGLQAPRKRPRFKTQPVTTEEVETAKGINPLVASFCKPPSCEELGGISISEVKNKIHEHAAKMLTNEVRGILKSKSAVSPINTTSPSPESDPKLITTLLDTKNGFHNSSSEDEGVSSDSSEPSEHDDKKNNESSSDGDSHKKIIDDIKISTEKYSLLDDRSSSEDSNEIDIINKDITASIEELKHISQNFYSYVEIKNAKNVVSVKSEVKDFSVVCRVQSSSTEGTPQTSDGESSGSREIKRISNEAVARRRQAAINRQKEKQSVIPKSRSSLFPHENPDDQAEPAFLRGGVRRSLTQPLRAHGQDMPGGGARSSIAERLAELQHAGHTDWKRRIKKDDDVLRSRNIYNDSLCVGRPTSILDEQKKNLETASQEWKKRVEPNDAINYSIAGRMLQPDKEISETVLNIANGEKTTPKPNRFRSRNADIKVTSTPVSPQKEVHINFKRSISAPGVTDDENENDIEQSTIIHRTVEVPRPDDETFTSFFEPISNGKTHTPLSLTFEDLDSVQRTSGDLLVHRKTVKVQRRHEAKGNPLKVLKERVDIKEEYTEVILGFAKREQIRINVEKLSKNSTLAVEALAGLASKEDFTKINLQKGTANSNVSLLPYKDLMLLHIKGRRHVQTRLVEPVATNINKGDNYVLVTPTQVYNYIGEFSNVIERNRGADIAMHIQQKRDLGCKCEKVITIEGNKYTCSRDQLETFWKLLGTEPNKEMVNAGHPDEDEIYESRINLTNMIYELQDDELVPVKEYWGQIPKFDMLGSSKVLIFDFGGEMYIWSGKNVPLDNRKIAVRLAKELWEADYDYSSCAISPINAVTIFGDRHNVNDPEKIGKRPSWALLAKLSEHGETILFKEKFLDWPDFSRVIKVKGEKEKINNGIIIKPCNAQEMLDNKLNEPDLKLEECHIGRGTSYYDAEKNHQNVITTSGVTVWHIQEFDHEELPKASIGQFYSGDSYVIRWQYRIIVTGRELSGKPSKHIFSGKERCAYFCWQGKTASLNEKGAAALLTVELDHEKGPQICISQNHEPPAFLNIFNGNMIVHHGNKSDSYLRKSPWRLYLCKGDLENETHLTEVPCCKSQLRSRASMLLINTQKGSILIWHGCKSPKHIRTNAYNAAKNIQINKMDDFGFDEDSNLTLSEIEEGEHHKDLNLALGKGDYLSLLKNSLSYTHTPRLFHLSSTSGEFKAIEVAPPSFSDEKTCAYPFEQSDLYSLSQPTLFLFDNCHELWLWQGWWPETDNSDSEGESDKSFSDQTGSGAVRWQNERKAAMQTVLDYRNGLKNTDVPAYLVWAGLEPLEFTNLFPSWIEKDDICEINTKYGRKRGEMLQLENELERLSQSTYPLTQLLQRPLPEGVDPTHLEHYLSDEDFIKLLGMEKPEFIDLPSWKQKKLKQEKGLF